MIRKYEYRYTTLNGTEYEATRKYADGNFSDEQIMPEPSTLIENLPDSTRSKRTRKRNAKAIATAYALFVSDNETMRAQGKDKLEDFVLDMLARISFHNLEKQWGRCDNCNATSRIYTYSIDLHGMCDMRTFSGISEEHIARGVYKPDARYAKCARCVANQAMHRLKSFTPNAFINSDTNSDKYEALHPVSSADYFDPTRYDFPETTQEEPLKCVCFGYVHQGQEVVTITDTNGDKVSVHRTCATRCGQCAQAFIHAGNWNVIPDNFNAMRMTYLLDEYACTPCVDKYLEDNPDVQQCGGCNAYVHEDDVCYSEVRDRSLCSSCFDRPVRCPECAWSYREGSEHECYLEQGSYIFDYSYKPKPKFYGEGKYHLGFELEVEHADGDDDYTNEMAQNVMGYIKGRAYCKHDGSLDAGFEVVSHPHTLEEYHTEFNWRFLRALRDDNFVSWNNSNCGIHVHVGLTAFNADTRKQSDMHRIRFAKFIYDNQNQVERIAGRRENSYAQFTDQGNVVHKMLTGEQREGRYEVVNVANSNTIEVRIFKGSLRQERVLSDIEFVHAVVEFTRNMKVVHKDKPFSWSRFVKFVVENDTQYPNLNTIIDEAFNSERIKAEI